MNFLEPGAWNLEPSEPVSFGKEGETKSALGVESLCVAVPWVAAASGSLRGFLCGLVPFVICTIDQKMGLLTLESGPEALTRSTIELKENQTHQSS